MNNLSYFLKLIVNNIIHCYLLAFSTPISLDFFNLVGLIPRPLGRLVDY